MKSVLFAVLFAVLFVGCQSPPGCDKEEKKDSKPAVKKAELPKLGSILEELEGLDVELRALARKYRKDEAVFTANSVLLITARLRQAYKKERADKLGRMEETETPLPDGRLRLDLFIDGKLVNSRFVRPEPAPSATNPRKTPRSPACECGVGDACRCAPSCRCGAKGFVPTVLVLPQITDKRRSCPCDKVGGCCCDKCDCCACDTCACKKCK